MGKNISKNITKNVSGKYCQKLLDHAKQFAADAIKTSLKRANGVNTIALQNEAIKLSLKNFHDKYIILTLRKGTGIVIIFCKVFYTFTFGEGT